MGPRAGLDRCRKSRLHRDSIPGPARSGDRIPAGAYTTIPTTLPGPHNKHCEGHNKEVTIVSALGSRREKMPSMHTLLEIFCVKSADYLTPHKFS